MVFAANTDIVINEIGAYPTSTHEWIEIWNRGSDPIDMNGWKFWEGSTNHGLAVSTTDSLLSPREYAVIVQDDTQFRLDYPNFSGSIFDSSWGSLSEGGEEIGLKDAAGNLLESFTYSPIQDISLERRDPYLPDYSPANWSPSLAGNTLGAQNSNYFHEFITNTDETATTTTATSSPSFDSHATTTIIIETASSTAFSLDVTTTNWLWPYLKINEFMPDPTTGPEWIELYNTTSTEINLTGSIFCDNRSEDSCAIAVPTNTISGFGWATIFLEGSKLNNTGDSVILKDPAGTVIDAIDYSEINLLPEKGQSVAREADGLDTDSTNDWSITLSPTFGSANIITLPPEPINNTASSASDSIAPKTTTNETKTSATTTKSTAKTQIKDAAVHIAWDIRLPPAAAPNELITLDASGSADPRGGRLSMRWNFGDGTFATGTAPSHIFTTTGTVPIIINVTSTAGTIDSREISLLVAPGLSAASTSILINEILPNPEGADTREFIELYNSGDVEIDISGWRLIDSSEKTFTFPAKTTIAPHTYLVFYRVATKISLDNTADTVSLETPTGSIVDQIEIPKAASGESFNRSETSWVWSASTTPGYANIVPLAQVLGEKINEEEVVSTTAKTKKSETKNTPLVQSLALADTRLLPKGTPVRVTGRITVLPNTFGAQYFYITDDEAGIQIYLSKKNFPRLALGDVVMVNGTLSIVNDTPRVLVKLPQDIITIASGQNSAARATTINEIEERTLGSLVAITGEVTERKTSYFYLDDGEQEIQVYLKTGARISKENIITGKHLTVSGVVEQVGDKQQLWPRSNEDVQIPPASPATKAITDEVISAKKQSLKNLGSSNTKKYLAIAGLTSVILVAAWLYKTKRLPWLKNAEKQTAIEDTPPINN